MPKPPSIAFSPPQKGGGALLHSVKAKTQPAVRNMYRSVRLLNTGHLPGGRRQGDRGHFHASLRPHTLIPHFYQNQTGSFTTNTSSQFYSPFTVIIFVRILAFFFLFKIDNQDSLANLFSPSQAVTTLVCVPFLPHCPNIS